MPSRQEVIRGLGFDRKIDKNPGQRFSIDLKTIVPHWEINPRPRNNDNIEALASNMRVFGYDSKYPMSVWTITEAPLRDGKSHLTAGHHRYEAAKKAGITSVPVITRMGKWADFLEDINMSNMEHCLSHGNIGQTFTLANKKTAIASVLTLPHHWEKSNRWLGKLWQVNEINIRRAREVILATLSLENPVIKLGGDKEIELPSEQHKELISTIKRGRRISEDGEVFDVKSRCKVREKILSMERSDDIVLPPTFSLIHCAIGELKQFVSAGSVDVILTDPPYPKEYLHCWQELAEFSAHALRPGGHVFAMSGSLYLPEVFANLKHDALQYRWALNLAMQERSDGINWHIHSIRRKHFLWYTKGHHQDRTITFPDVIEGSGRDKDYHEWGQSVGELVYIIDRLSKGQGGITICDPFLGGGTTAVAAEMTNCSFVGADIDNQCIRDTKIRLDTMKEIS